MLLSQERIEEIANMLVPAIHPGRSVNLEVTACLPATLYEAVLFYGQCHNSAVEFHSFC